MTQLAVDLHCHSSFAGGASQRSKYSLGSSEAVARRVLKRFQQAEENMPLKGIQVLGTGDCQFEPWYQLLMDNLEEVERGIWQQQGGGHVKYVLQTELIFTAPIGRRRKQVHVVILFPDPTRIRELQELLKLWDVKHETMARPFIPCDSIKDVETKIYSIQDLDNWIEIIPAHIMTPTGVYGSDVRINQLSQFFGSASEIIRVVETGLSADPELLSMIPELHARTLLSNSDAHSPQLHRIGREFTVLEIRGNLTYSSIVEALRKKSIAFTAEFPPAEGRYFLTGHRKGRKDGVVHQQGGYCAFSPEFVPKDERCPLCGKKLTIGVLQRICEIHEYQRKSPAFSDIPLSSNSTLLAQQYMHLIPLIDVICFSLKIKSPTSKKVLSVYRNIISEFGPEVELWRKSPDQILSEVTSTIPPQVVKAIVAVKNGQYGYFPPGHDGEYGKLVIGRTFDYWHLNLINYG